MLDWLNTTSTVAPPSNQTMASVQTAVSNPAAGASTVTPTTGITPTTVGGAQGGGFLGPNFASNAGVVLGGVQALGSLWNSIQQNKLAKKSIGLQEEAFRANLGDQRKSYNSALEDRIRSRYNTEGRSSSEADAYIDKNKL